MVVMDGGILEIVRLRPAHGPFIEENRPLLNANYKAGLTTKCGHILQAHICMNKEKVPEASGLSA